MLIERSLKKMILIKGADHIDKYTRLQFQLVLNWPFYHNVTYSSSIDSVRATIQSIVNNNIFDMNFVWKL